jgi:signal transduction histidine kinase
VALVAEQQRSALDRAKFEASNLSGAFEFDVRQAIGNTWSAMEAMKAGIAANGTVATLAQWFLNRSPEARCTHMTALDSDGKVLYSTADPAWRGADLSDREHFKVHATNPQAGFFIGQNVVARSSHRLKIPMSIRINRPDGFFGGTLFATVEPEFLTLLYHSVNLGQTGTLMLAGTDGAVRAYLSRGLDGGAGKATAEADGTEIPALRAAALESKGFYEGRSAPDGVARLYSWRKIEGYPLIVIVGLGKAEALSASLPQRYMVLAAGSIAVFFTMLMPLLLSCEISKRISHEIELSREKENLTLANDALDDERKNLHVLNAQLSESTRQAEEASQAKSDFLAYMSHEFRTPMHAILAYTKMALEDVESGDQGKLKKYIENARAAELRLLGLLNNLLDFAKLEAGKIELQTGKANLLDIVEGCRLELSSLLVDKGLSLSVSARASDSSATVDTTRLTQVLVNLFSNAIKFSPPGGCIQVEISDARLPDGRVGLQCSVSDQGTGIPDQELATIFGRFNQSSTTKKNRTGTGLGLAICRELIGLHGGKIWAENRPEGGAVISFAIPKEIAARADAAPSEPAPQKQAA